MPRVWTPPLVELTPDTSYGYSVIDFARDVVGTPLDPWQELAVIHLGELLPDGRPRFRTVIILVGRQNGKTLLAKILIMYWMFVEQIPLTLGTSTDRSYAKRTWMDVVKTIQNNEWLKQELLPTSIRLTVGEECITTNADAQYIFAANSGRAARSTTLHRWICDELREHHNRDCWDSATNAMNAVAGAQTICITNEGDDESIMLDSLRQAALDYIETGEGDPRLGILAWTAPPGSDPEDIHALAAANPNLGRRVNADALLGAAKRAKRAGGIELAAFRTEVMCMRVAHFDSAIDPDLWMAAGTDTPIDLAEHRRALALCLDVSLDGQHATVAAAATVDGCTHVEIVAAWNGHDCTQQLRAQLPGLATRIKPRVIGWFPAGPAAAVAADMQERRRTGWPPRRVRLEELRAEMTAVCMGLATHVASGSLQHPNDPMLNAHIGSAAKLRRGDMWVFGRRGTGPVDGAYAVAGAVHLARTLPPLPPPLSVA